MKNLTAAFRAALRGTPCEEFIESMKVVTASALTYPDVVVTCCPVLQDADVVPQPVLIVEVLSPGTQFWDPRVERYARGSEGWSYQVFEGIDSTVALTRPAINLRLADVYERIDFPPVPTTRL